MLTRAFMWCAVPVLVYDLAVALWWPPESVLRLLWRHITQYRRTEPAVRKGRSLWDLILNLYPKRNWRGTSEPETALKIKMSALCPTVNDQLVLHRRDFEELENTRRRYHSHSAVKHTTGRTRQVHYAVIAGWQSMVLLLLTLYVNTIALIRGNDSVFSVILWLAGNCTVSTLFTLLT